MRLTLLHELAQFLTELEEAQENLLDLFTAKRKAIDTFQSEELIRLSAREQVLAARLQELVKARMALLIRARDAGLSGRVAGRRLRRVSKIRTKEGASRSDDSPQRLAGCYVP